MIRHNFIHYNGSKLHYARTGNGKNAMLVFHGFGQDLSTFDHFTYRLAPHYTFYVFDLYFHGASEWAHGERPLSKDDWKETIQAFLLETKLETFSLAGFSLGGKFVLATLEAFPEKIAEVILIAPDGIKTNFWYSLATYPLAFRRFFKSMILHPERFLRMAAFLNQRGLVDKGLLRFADWQMGSEEKRRRVYYSWIVFRKLSFNIDKLASIINDYHIRTLVIVGAYDNVIPPKNMEGFVRRLKKVRFEVLQSGHHGLINQSLPFVMHD